MLNLNSQGSGDRDDNRFKPRNILTTNMIQAKYIMRKT